MFVTEWNSGYVFGVTSLDMKTVGFMIMVGRSCESNFHGLDRTFFKSQKFPLQNSRTNIWHMTPGVTKTSHTCTNIQNPEKHFVNALWFTRISRKKKTHIFPKVLIKVHGMYGYYHLLDKNNQSGMNWACSSFNHIKTLPGWHVKAFKKSQNVPQKTAKFQQHTLIHLGNFGTYPP